MQDSHHHGPAFVQDEARYQDARKVTIVGAVATCSLMLAGIWKSRAYKIKWAEYLIL